MRKLISKERPEATGPTRKREKRGLRFNGYDEGQSCDAFIPAASTGLRSLAAGVKTHRWTYLRNPLRFSRF